MALRWLVLRCAGALLLAGALVSLAPAQLPASASERSVKAAYIYKFLGYVEWPTDAFPVPDAPLVIGVVGADQLAGDLADLTRGRNVNGHPIEVRRMKAGEALTGVDVLFVGAAERNRLPVLARAAATHAVLVITEDENGLDEGAVINFVLVNGHVRFEVALDAADRAGIRLSSRLLAVAQFVRMGSR
jgi:hypothetical protein